jgi:hypothetical protein
MRCADARRLRASLLLGGATLLLSGAAAELFLRAFYPCPWYGYEMIGWQRGLYQLDPVLGKRGVPGARAPFASRDYHVEVVLDAEGNRSSVPDFVPGKRNFVALGDSYTWGWGGEGHEVWAELLMQQDPQLDVYNLAIPGTPISTICSTAESPACSEVGGRTLPPPTPKPIAWCGA